MENKEKIRGLIRQREIYKTSISLGLGSVEFYKEELKRVEEEINKLKKEENV